jgi:hypothetical protein
MQDEGPCKNDNQRPNGQEVKKSHVGMPKLLLREDRDDYASTKCFLYCHCRNQIECMMHDDCEYETSACRCFDIIVVDALKDRLTITVSRQFQFELQLQSYCSSRVVTGLTQSLQVVQ